MPTLFSVAALAHLQESFITLVLPKVLAHGRVAFRGIQCPNRREDAIQEMLSGVLSIVVDEDFIRRRPLS